MRKFGTIAAALLAAIMMMAPGATAQVPDDVCYGDVDVENPDPRCVEPTEEPTEGGGVSPIDVTRPPEEPSRGAPRPAAQPQLAETGMTLSVGLIAGFGLLTFGGVLLLGTRRRKSAVQ